MPDGRLRSAIAAAGAAGDWLDVWRIADMLGVEISLLFDSESHIWVDIGDPGSVRLHPPAGAVLPFHLWVHTHPRDAYWSETDRRTLASSARILEQALVLGHDHFKRACCGKAAPEPRLSLDGPLSMWSDERISPYRSEVSE